MKIDKEYTEKFLDQVIQYLNYLEIEMETSTHFFESGTNSSSYFKYFGLQDNLLNTRKIMQQILGME